MSDRRYTVAEIDQLRQAVDSRMMCERAGIANGGMMRAHPPSADEARAIEERVRTHMMAGHTAEDLWAAS